MDGGGQRGGLEGTRGGQGGCGGGGSNERTILFNKIASNRHRTTTRKRSLSDQRGWGAMGIWSGQ